MLRPDALHGSASYLLDDAYLAVLDAGEKDLRTQLLQLMVTARTGRSAAHQSVQRLLASLGSPEKPRRPRTTRGS